MKLLRSCAVAFAMYSKIPMPRTEWSKENMKYAMCFFPLVGAVCGVLLFLWVQLAAILQLGPFLNAAVCALLPLAVTGGIHLDGFCDTVDARASHQNAACRLLILSDPHIGAFGVMGCIVILLGTFALWTEYLLTTAGSLRLILVLCLGFVLSRALSGLSVVTLKAAKKTGTLAEFATNAEKTTVQGVLLGLAVSCAAGMVLLSPVAGGVAVAAAGLVFWRYRAVAYHNFGGITGDLAGWFLTLCELAVLAAVVFAGRFVA